MHDRPVIRIEVPARDGRDAQIDLRADVFSLPAAAQQVSEELRRDILDLAAHQHVAMRPDHIRAQRRIGPPDDHGLAAAPEFRGNALHAAPLADFAGDADEIGSDVEIDRRYVFVAEPDLEIAGREGSDGRDREVGHRGCRRKTPGAEHFGTEIARKISQRIDQIEGFCHSFPSYRSPAKQRL